MGRTPPAAAATATYLTTAETTRNYASCCWTLPRASPAGAPSSRSSTVDTTTAMCGHGSWYRDGSGPCFKLQAAVTVLMRILFCSLRQWPDCRTVALLPQEQPHVAVKSCLHALHALTTPTAPALAAAKRPFKRMLLMVTGLILKMNHGAASFCE